MGIERMHPAPRFSSSKSTRFYLPARLRRPLGSPLRGSCIGGVHTGALRPTFAPDNAHNITTASPNPRSAEGHFIVGASAGTPAALWYAPRLTYDGAPCPSDLKPPRLSTRSSPPSSTFPRRAPTG